MPRSRFSCRPIWSNDSKLSSHSVKKVPSALDVMLFECWRGGVGGGC